MTDQKRAGCSLIIINHKDQILLLLRDNIEQIPYPDMWDLPGGQVEADELPEQAIVREMNEEMGLILSDPILFRVTNFPDRIEYTYWINLELDLNKIDLKEGQRLSWFSYSQIKKMVLAFRFNQVIDQFMQEAPYLKNR